MTDDQPKPGLTPERVSMFTDAVLAIAITLLALEIPRPNETDLEDLGGFLNKHGISFFSFALAFVMLWFAWRAHHTLLDQLRRVSQLTLTVHIPLLLFAAFMPYATHIFGEVTSLDDPPAHSISWGLALFGGTEAVLMICLALLFTFAARQGLCREDVNLDRVITYAAVNWGIGLLWALSAVVAFIAPNATAILWWLTPVVTTAIVLIRRRIVRHRKTVQ